MNTNEHTPEAGDTNTSAENTSATTDAKNGMDAGNSAGVGGDEATITALQAEVADLRTRAEDAEKRLLYVQAEFQTFKQRTQEQRIGDLKYANSEFITNLLPVLDNFERALKAAEQTRNYDALIGGVNGTLKQLTSALEKAGVTPIEAVGREFDPTYHEAIGHADDSGLPPNTVAEEVQKGYRMHDRVLRPSLVRVAQG